MLDRLGALDEIRLPIVAWSASWIAGFVAGPALMRWLAPGIFAVILLVLMTLELVTAYGATTPPARAVYPWGQKITTKLLLLSLIVVAASLDISLHLLFGQTDNEWGFRLWADGLVPVTLSTLLWLNTAESLRVIQNVAKAAGEEAVPMPMMLVIRALRAWDQQRFGNGTPNRRALDRMTEAEVARFTRDLAEAEQRKRERDT